jgi:hypothetical protein
MHLEIAKIENMERFVYLQSFDLSHNNLNGSQRELSTIINLRELKLAHNQISCLEGLEAL